jgi:endonuclease YncB( thermonuclease family)
MKYILALLLAFAVSYATVARIIDGDTLVLTNGQTVRILGIDTPERGECGYLIAKNALDGLVENRVSLRRSTVGDKDGVDFYRRLLRYVGDNHRDVGYNLVRYGFAESFRRYPHDRLLRYNVAEARARTELRGLWRTCGHP